MRVALLTPESITEPSNPGGPGKYLNPITRTLRNVDHEPEVFVSTDGTTEVLAYDGVRVEHVAPARSLVLRKARRLTTWDRSVPKGSPGSLDPDAPLEHTKCFDHIFGGLRVGWSKFLFRYSCPWRFVAMMTKRLL